MMKRLICVLLTVLLLAGAVPLAASAEQAEPVFRGVSPAEPVGDDSYCFTASPEPMSVSPMSDAGITAVQEVPYNDMTASQDLIDVIKDAEGFSPTPYWDYSQYTIGYGTVCGYRYEDVPSDYWNGISEYHAEQLLREHVDKHAEYYVNLFFDDERKVHYPVTQSMFDAMVDFTYGLGPAWIYDSRVADVLKVSPNNELDVMRALGAWCRVNGEVFPQACSRRIREGIIFSEGEYYLPHGGSAAGNSSLEVVNDRNLPYFRYTIFDGNGTTLVNNRTDDVSYYRSNRDYGSLPVPTRSNYTFYGWFDENGDVLLENHPVQDNLEVEARWVQLPFRDIPARSWYTTAVAYCYYYDILTGVTDGQFQPNEPMTRGMLVTSLYRLAGAPKVKKGAAFVDVNPDSYYADAVTWASQKGIVKGYGDDTFRPAAPVTRAQMVTFVSRYASVVEKADTASSHSLNGYQDAGNVPGYAVGPFKWALEEGLIKGMEQNQLMPDAQATRAQLAKVLMIVTNLK